MSKDVKKPETKVQEPAAPAPTPRKGMINCTVYPKPGDLNYSPPAPKGRYTITGTGRRKYAEEK